MTVHLLATFVCGLIIGASIAGLSCGVWLAYLRRRYVHLNDALKVVRTMRERGL